MATLEVQAQPRPAMGKQVKKLRREGVLPAVVYGPAVEGVQPLSLIARDFVKIFAQAGPSTLLSLKVQGSAAHQVLIHDVQYDHYHRNLIHVDFFALDMRAELTISVPLAFTGEAPGVTVEDGIALHLVSEVQVRTLPANIPAAIEVDMSGLTAIGSQLTAGELPLPRGVALVTPAEELIVRINPPTVVEEPEVAEEVEEAEAAEAAAEGEEQPTAEAEAPAADSTEEPQG
jgi:large subunit ribosomal protein L25